MPGVLRGRAAGPVRVQELQGDRKGGNIHNVNYQELAERVAGESATLTEGQCKARVLRRGYTEEDAKKVWAIIEKDMEF